MGDVSADATFETHKGTAHIFVSGLTGHATITLSIDDYENLADFIHEINEIEICTLLKREFDVDPNLYIELSSEIKWLPLVESKVDSLAEKKKYKNVPVWWKSDLVLCTIHATHLVSPYGYNCFIGRPDPPLEW